MSASVEGVLTEAANEAPEVKSELREHVVEQNLVDRPSDYDILAQQNAIRVEEANKPYVSERLPLESLKAEYEYGSEIFLRKIESLEGSYGFIRRTRGDGNCFFRGFIFACLEYLLKYRDIDEAERLTSVIKGWHGKLVDAGFQALVFEDAMDLLLDQIRQIQDAITGTAVSRSDSFADQPDLYTIEILEANMRDDTVSNMIVMLLRLITSAELQRRQDFFEPFVLGMYDDAPATMFGFCQRFVEPMGEESDHVHIVAITDALQTPATVVYMDRSDGAGNNVLVNTHEFIPEGCPPKANPYIHLLYRPGHYDILYPSVGQMPPSPKV